MSFTSIYEYARGPMRSAGAHCDDDGMLGESKAAGGDGTAAVAATPNRRGLHASASEPALPARDEGMTQHERYVEAFKLVDTDGSGTISKRELLAILKKVGLKDTKSALDLFQGFDVNGDGQLSFEEFEHIAKTVLK